MTYEHKDVPANKGVNHVPYDWTYANAAARTGASGFVSADVGKLARQTDNNTLWMLTATTPTWAQQSIPLVGGVIPSSYLPAASDTASDLPMFNAFLSQLSAARASGAVPNGWCWLFKTDELAVKTNATYDATGDYYGNGGVTSKVTITSDMLSKSANIGDWNAAQLVDGNTGTPGFSAGMAGISDWVQVTFPTAKTISQARLYVDGTTTAQWYVQYYNGSTWVSVATLSLSGGAGWKSITWTPSGSSTQWRIRPVYAPGAGPTYTELEMYETSATTNMTLKPSAITLSAEPGTATLYLLHKAVDTVTLGTDLKIRGTLDGTNWSSFGTLETVCAYDADYNLLKAELDLSALTGTSFAWEITTLNAKSQRVRAVAALFS